MDNQHRFTFDRDNLAHHCREAGFDRYAPRAVDPQVALEARDDESLSMVRHKPVAA